jgi:UrcA family protein
MLRISKLRTLTEKNVPTLATGAAILSGAMALALATASAVAQNYPGGPPNEVVVSSPEGIQRSTDGQPIVVVSLSRAVQSDDLDLRTEDGAQAFQARVRAAARSVCNRLNYMYPATYEGWGAQWAGDRDCYRGAMKRANPEIDAAISTARGQYGGH